MKPAKKRHSSNAKRHPPAPLPKTSLHKCLEFTHSGWGAAIAQLSDDESATILQSGIDLSRVNGLDVLDETLLLAACTYERVKTVGVLVGLKHINVNLKHLGHTPLTRALSKQSEEITLMLLQHKNIDVNKAGAFQLTPLYTACVRGWEAMVKRLLAFPGVNVNVGKTLCRDPSIWPTTPLAAVQQMRKLEGIAKERQYAEITRKLLRMKEIEVWSDDFLKGGQHLDRCPDNCVLIYGFSIPLRDANTRKDRATQRQQGRRLHGCRGRRAVWLKRGVR